MWIRLGLLILFVVVLQHSYVTRAFFNGAAAVDLIGHYVENDGITPDYTESSSNDVPGLYGVSTPGVVYAIDYTNHRLFIPESGNNRVLVFNLNSSDQLVDRTPDYVLGQSTFYTNTSRTTQSGMAGPTGVLYDDADQRLFVSEVSNNRVTVFDVSSITNGENAVNVLGQSVFTTNTATTTQSGMAGPRGLAYDPISKRLFVALGSGSNRVTVYDVASITNGENAINVLGQTTFTGTTGATTQSGMNFPTGLVLDVATQKLFVSQITSNRVTTYNVATSTITNGANAVNVLGQTTFTGSSASNAQSGMSGPMGLAYDAISQRLFVMQQNNSRTTVYDVTSITNGENAINILGQTNYSGTAILVSQLGLGVPQGGVYDATNNRLYIGQSNPVHRISVFDVATSSITDGMNAIDLIGHYLENDGVTPNYTESGANDTPGLHGLAGGAIAAFDGVDHRLFVLDSNNHRVLVFNLNSSNRLIDRTPDYVLGQSTFYTNVATTTQSGMSFPYGIAYDSTTKRLFVAQGGNHRVTVYDVTSITNGENAVNVLGQSSFTTGVPATTQAGMNGPGAIVVDENRQRLFVAQTAQRVTVYDINSITNGENAVNVLGQTDFVSSSGSDTQNGIVDPSDLAYDPDSQRLFVAQSNSHRVTVFDVTSITDGENAINVLGQTTFTDIAGANTQSGMSGPAGLAYDSLNKRLFVAQSGNHRVTVYDVTSIVDGEDATGVIGQSTFTGSASALNQTGLTIPQGLEYDSSNHRLLVGHAGGLAFFETAPISAELSTSTSSSTDESTADNFVTLLVTGTSTGTSTVQLDITGGTATAVTDYTSSDPITITIPPGVYDGTASTSIAITLPTLVQDTLVETGGETITFSLINPNNVIIEDVQSDTVIQSSYTYTITDDDVASVVSPNTAPPVIGPIGGSAPVSVPVLLNSATTASPQVFIRTLKLNSKGVDVKELQKFLNSHGFPVAKKGPGSKGKETTLFGPATKAALIKFQKANKITPANGVVGEKTRKKMKEMVGR